jgi:hypothetical protein
MWKNTAENYVNRWNFQTVLGTHMVHTLQLNIQPEVIQSSIIKNTLSLLLLAAVGSNYKLIPVSADTGRSSK